MRCPRCQHENPSGSNFCLGCGARLGLRCASCGSDLPTGSRFCNKCGHAVGDQVDSDRRFSSPDTYTPKHLAEKILTSKSALEAERKQVTVLFADLKGSMELLADRDPEEARKLLDPVLERMMEAVHRYEGTVNQVMGDGIMALFGAPVAHEDHAVRACYAALDMQGAIRRYADEVWRTDGVTVKIRVGQVPATVQAVLAARIDRLLPGDKALLQTASVIGKDVPLALLQAVAEPVAGELHAAIGRLQIAEFLYEASLFPDPEYTFKHALTHDVAYGSLLQDRRRAIHGRIVATIEQLYPDRLAEHIERLAHHAFRGELWEKAVTYLRQAGTKALGRSASREAAAYFEQALTALTHLPETRETREQAIDVRLDLRGALFALAEFGRIDGYLRQAETLARNLDDQRRLGWVSAHMTSYHMVTGAPAAEARTSAQRVQAIGETLADVPLQVAAQYYQVHIGYMSGDHRGTEDACRRLMELLQGDRTRERFNLWQFPAVLSRAFLARALAERGLFDEGETHGHEAIRIAEALDHRFSLIEACLGLAYVHGASC
jgi:class 3 adenylate cyclase